MMDAADIFLGPSEAKKREALREAFEQITALYLVLVDCNLLTDKDFIEKYLPMAKHLWEQSLAAEADRQMEQLEKESPFLAKLAKALREKDEADGC